MKYNYLTLDHKLFRINEERDYSQIIKLDGKECNCNGRVLTFYIVNGSKIPTNRAIRI